MTFPSPFILPLCHGSAVEDGVLLAGVLASREYDMVRYLGGGVRVEPHDVRLPVGVQLVRRAKVSL